MSGAPQSGGLTVPKIKIAIAGLGKIARGQHVPTLASSGDFTLAAVASPGEALDGVPGYTDVEALLREQPGIEAVACCTPPQARYAAAHLALRRGKHVLLEKPPTTTVGELMQLAEIAGRQNLALFAAWHSRHADGVEPARRWLADREILSARILWKEDVRVWHPGQRWIWEAGGLGVFDPGINALSIATTILPGPLAMKHAELFYPRNCQTPIAARLSLAGPRAALVRAEFDFLQPGAPLWDIEVETDAGVILLSNGGRDLAIDGKAVPLTPGAEYPRLYQRFAALVRGRSIDADPLPLQLAADAFLCGQRIEVDPFID